MQCLRLGEERVKGVLRQCLRLGEERVKLLKGY